MEAVFSVKVILCTIQNEKGNTMRIWFILSVMMVSAIVFQAVAQPVQFKIPIVFQSGPYIDTLWIGVHGDGPEGEITDNTYGPDGSSKFGQLGEWKELLYPPDFPKMKFNVKFINIPRRVEIPTTGLKPCDFRGFTSSKQIDSFAIKVYGDSIVCNPLKISWPENLGDYGRTWRLLKKQGKKYKTIVNNMITTAAYTETKVKKMVEFEYLLIKSGLVLNSRREEPIHRSK